jgi:hypothetical protein
MAWSAINEQILLILYS